MPQHIVDDRPHVIGSDVVPVVQPGVGAGAAVDADRAARARADLDPLR